MLFVERLFLLYSVISWCHSDVMLYCIQTCAHLLLRLATVWSISLYGTMTRPLIDVLSSSTVAAAATKTDSAPEMRVRPDAASARPSFLVLVSAKRLTI